MKPRHLIPMLICRDADAEVAFCQAAFGADVLSKRTAPNGSTLHALLNIQGALVMVHDVRPTLASQAPGQDGSSPVVIYLYGEAVDPVMEQAVHAGAKVLAPAADQSWGDRVGRVMDPEGHVWNIASRIADGSG